MVNLLAKVLSAFALNANTRKAVRKKIKSYLYGYQFRKRAKYGDGLFFGGSVEIACKQVIVADHVNFNGARLLGRGQIKIGKYFHSGFGLIILTQNHEFEGAAIPYDDNFRIKDVEIGDFVWCGLNVTILPGTRIGKGAIIQAGSVVHGTIPDFAIAGGNPAKVFAYRDVEHFNQLEHAGKFH